MKSPHKTKETYNVSCVMSDSSLIGGGAEGLHIHLSSIIIKMSLKLNSSQRKKKKQKDRETEKESDKERQRKFTGLLQSIFQLRLILSIINSPQQQFADFRVHQNYLEGLLGKTIARPHPQSFKFNRYKMRAGISIWDSSKWC